MNTRLLRKVQKHIMEEPRRLNMDIMRGVRDPAKKNNPPCGTVACIAGWTEILIKKGLSYNTWEIARRALNITQTQSQKLFAEPRLYNSPQHYGGNGWPENFALAYIEARSAAARARVTSDRIDHFIKTKGKE